jgi:hypothetical protein
MNDKPNGCKSNDCKSNDFELDDLNMELMSLDGKRYHCSQILMILGLRLLGRDVGQNTDLIRAAGGLTVGLGHSNETCGALLGGACLLGLYGGKGHDGEEESEWFRMSVRRLVDWFRETYAEAGEDGTPSIRCADILNRRGLKQCGLMVRGVYSKVLELLDEYRVDPSEGRSGSAAS